MEESVDPVAAREPAPLALAGGAVVGRGAELGAIASMLQDDAAASSGVLLEGEPGIGKTTVWEHGVQAARELSLRVLTSRPAETEAELPYAALGDLLEPVLEERLPLLAEPQRLALEVALLRSPPGETPTEQLAVSLAVLDVLRRPRAEPVVLAIDDVQWLDASSSRVLEFALRRLGDLPVRLLLARRDGREQPLPLGLERGVPVRRLPIGPLDVDELGRLVAARLDAQLPRPRLVELHRTSHGNPYYALEIVRSFLDRDTELAWDQALPIPESIGALLRRRLDVLSSAASDAIMLAATAAHPTWSLLQSILGSTAGLDEAAGAAILAREGGRVRFVHPLLASIAYDAASPQARRAAHLRLGAAADDLEERVRHLALGTESPDERVSAELDSAAAAAARRGAPASAAQLLELSVRLTPEDRLDDRRRRLAAAADHHYSAGDQPRSRAILETLADELPAGPERARALVELSHRVASQLDGLTLCRHALVEAGDDPVLKADLHFYAAASARRAATLPEAVDHARLAVEFAEASRDDVRHARALAMLGHVETMSGLGGGIELLERATELESSLDAASLHFRASFLFGITLLYLGELTRARPFLRAQLERANDRGDEVMRGVALSTLAELELRAGNWPQAYRLAADGAQLQEQAAPLQDQAHHVLRVARVSAHMGRLDEARPVALRLLELAPQHGDRFAEISARRDLAFMELSLGNAAATVELLEPAMQLQTAMGLGLFTAQPIVHDYVEALVAVDELDRADEANDVLAGSTQPWNVAVHARGRALIAAARGDNDTALASVADALEAHGGLEEPFELGRTQLVAGVVERRARRRAAARASLTSALETFDELGAALWAERAAAELARIPGRSPSTSLELTPMEREVAELVAEGGSNKEVAAALFLAVRTVEAHLSNVYAKLGIRSRSELARRLDSQKSAGIHDVGGPVPSYVGCVIESAQQPLSRYLVAIDRPGVGWSHLQALTARARAAAAEQRLAGTPVRFLRAIMVAEDDACLLLYEGPTRAAVRAAAAGADLGPSRVRRLVAAAGSGQHA